MIVDNGFEGIQNLLASASRCAALPSSSLNDDADIGSLDLISHSRDVQMYLSVGGWIVNDSAETQDRFVHLRDLLHGVGITAVRTSGCGTAMRSEGKRAMKRISDGLGGGFFVGDH